MPTATQSPPRHEQFRTVIKRAVKNDARSQAQIATDADMSAGRLSNYLAGKCDLHTETFARLAAALKLKLRPVA